MSDNNNGQTPDSETPKENEIILQADESNGANQSSQTSNEASKPTFDAKPVPKLKTRKKMKQTKLFPAISVLLALLALIVAGWSSYSQHLTQQQWQRLQTQQKQQTAQQAQLLQKSQQATQLSQQIAEKNQQTINQQAQLLQQLNQALTATQEKVRALSGRQKQDWLLAEAEYLVKLAQLKIILEKDILTAIALLQTADQRVLEIADNSLLELRQVIAQDIANLQLAKMPDISGIASQIHALSDQVPTLSLIALEFQPLDKANKMLDEQSLPQTTEFNWEEFYQKFLDDFVHITNHNEPVTPLMTPEQRGNLNANIQLALQQAQIALFRGDQNLYNTNLNNASDWIAEFFKNNETAKTILTQLAQLAQLSVEAQLPSQLNVLETIQTINQQRLYQWLEAKQQSAPADNNDQTQTPVIEEDIQQ